MQGEGTQKSTDVGPYDWITNKENTKLSIDFTSESVSITVGETELWKKMHGTTANTM